MQPRARVCHKEKEQQKCTQTACLYEKTLRASKQVGELVCEVRLWKQVLVLHIQVDSISEEATGEDRIRNQTPWVQRHPENQNKPRVMVWTPRVLDGAGDGAGKSRSKLEQPLVGLLSI